MGILEISSRFLGAAKRYRKERDFVRKIRELLREGIRGIMVKGLRGTGKTVGLLQILRENKGVYIPADHPYVLRKGIYDSFLEAYHESSSNCFGFDEVHKIPEWELHVKAIFGEFPDVKLIVTGSSASKLMKTGADISRRFITVNSSFLSFSEFIYFVNGKKPSLNFYKLLRSPIEEGGRALEYSRYLDDYLIYGGFPLFVEYGKRSTELIYRAIEKSIEEDFGYSEERKAVAKRILIYLALSKPGEFNFEKVSRILGTSKDTVYRTVHDFVRAGIIRQIFPKGVGRVKKLPKLLFSHPNLRASILLEIGEELEIGALREEAVAFWFSELGININYIKGMRKNPDFIAKVGKREEVFEVGGKSKKSSQIARGGYIIGGLGKRKIPLEAFLLSST